MRPTEAATKFVFIFDDDLHALAEVDEDFRETWDNTDWRELFSGQDTPAREAFVKAEAKLVAACTTAFPPLGTISELPPGLPAPSLSDTTGFVACIKCCQKSKKNGQGTSPT